jgi:N-methylhydantoinase B
MVVPGEWRGGIGSVRVFTYLADGGFSVEGDGQKHRPWGFDGGTDGHPGQLILETAAGKHLALPSKVPYRKAARGDRLLAYGPSGGGCVAIPPRCSTMCSMVSSHRKSPVSMFSRNS